MSQTPPWFDALHDDEWGIYRRGIEEFNAEEWFEAHEVWEDNWHLATGHRKLFYQGLIQAAVTLEHGRRGNPRGVRSVWMTCQQKFEDLPEAMLGLNIRQLLEGVLGVISPVLDLPDSWFLPGLPHGRPLPLRWELAPKITLRPDP